MAMTNEEFLKELEKIPIGSNGVFNQPFLGVGGERAPFVKSSATAQFIDLKPNHTKYHLARATYSMKDCYEKFTEEYSAKGE